MDTEKGWSFEVVYPTSMDWRRKWSGCGGFFSGFPPFWILTWVVCTRVRGRDSKVEAKVLQRSRYSKAGFFSDERIPTLVVDNFPSMGKITALRFIEWVQANPGGVVSLPTGKTPEYFIRWTHRILSEWGSEPIVMLLEAYGLNASEEAKPDMFSLTFVQIDEFFPINPKQSNSFHAYVQEFYIRDMGMDPAKALLIDSTAICDVSVFDLDQGVDLSLRYRAPANEKEASQKAEIIRVDQVSGDVCCAVCCAV